MTLQQLRYVTAIAETGTLSEAARRFYIAQPSLTASLRELEDTCDQLALLHRALGDCADEILARGTAEIESRF